MISCANDPVGLGEHLVKGAQGALWAESGCSFSVFPPRSPGSQIESLDLFETDHVVNQVRHRDRSLVAIGPDASVPCGAHAHAHRAEDVFHPDTDAGLGAVAFALPGCEGLVPVGAFDYLGLNPLALEGRFTRRTRVGAVHIGNRVSLPDQLFQRLAVVDRRVGDREDRKSVV